MKSIDYFIIIVLIFFFICSPLYSEATANLCHEKDICSLRLFDEIDGVIYDSKSIFDIANNNYIDFGSLRNDKEFIDYVLFIIKNLNEKIISFETKNKYSFNKVQINIVYRHKDYKDSIVNFLNKVIKDKSYKKENKFYRDLLYKELLSRENFEKKLHEIDSIFLNAKNKGVIIESPWVKIYFHKHNTPYLFLVFVYSYPQILLDQAILDGMNWEGANLSTDPIPYYDSRFQVLYEKYLKEMSKRYYSYDEIMLIDRKFSQLPIYFLWYCRETQPFFFKNVQNYGKIFEIKLKQDVADLYKKITSLMLDRIFDGVSSYEKYENILNLQKYIDLYPYNVKGKYRFSTKTIDEDDRRR